MSEKIYEKKRRCNASLNTLRGTVAAICGLSHDTGRTRAIHYGLLRDREHEGKCSGILFEVHQQAMQTDTCLGVIYAPLPQILFNPLERDAHGVNAFIFLKALSMKG